MIQNSQQKLWEIHKDEKKVTKVILCHFLFLIILVKIISVRESEVMQMTSRRDSAKQKINEYKLKEDFYHGKQNRIK